jgi:hypothetical protein
MLEADKYRCESEQMENVAAAKAFLAAHPELISKRRLVSKPDAKVMCEASKHQRALNVGIKTLLALGGKMPSVFFETNRVAEALALILGGNTSEYGGLYTHYHELAVVPVSGLSSDVVNIRELVAARSALVLRSFDPKNNRIRSRDDLDKPAKLEEKGPFTVHDALHIRFENKHPPIDGDLGFVVPDYTNERLISASVGPNGDVIQQWIEGALRRQFVVSDWLRICAQARGPKSGGCLSIMAEERTDTGLARGKGKLPSFWNGSFEFGGIDVTKDVPIAERDRFHDMISDALHGELGRQIVAQVEHEIGVAHGRVTDKLIRGGRDGLNLSLLYRQFPRAAKRTP